MLKNRLITVLTFNDGVLFRTRNFIPDYRYTLNFVDAWSIDEIVVLDITRFGQGSKDHFFTVVSDFARNCFVPLAAGGGVRTINDFKRLLRFGADKIIINSEALRRPEFIREAAMQFGSQCVVVSIDARRMPSGDYEVFSEFGNKATGLDVVTWARKAQASGAGEIMLTSIDRDGTLEGYDNYLNRIVSEAIDIPVLVSGGVGKWQDFVDGFKLGKAQAVCTTNIYHFTETSIRSAKQFLAHSGIDVRV
ncbi:MAG: imidazole glycerol phosphate synthase cyclase subunit [Candidatus Omnitrophica bacterium]|jgi:cyclase|nr:imidazole glycerol phosphate synthase cyclase subunit [Candidatus Omnitrophota bacterium]MDD5660337.1 imidazole glycerol phosphate synthase cyclase subunit [Candidatus Omnitrophota bacterium]